MLRTSLMTRRILATGAGAAKLTFGALAAPADAATRQNGLINVALTDTTVQVPIAVAANICGVGVGVLSAALVQGPVNCDATSSSTGTVIDNGGNDNARQDGLVNVSATDTVVQIPIGIAANICGVAANVLAGPTVQFPVTCDSDTGAVSIVQ